MQSLTKITEAQARVDKLRAAVAKAKRLTIRANVPVAPALKVA